MPRREGDVFRFGTAMVELRSRATHPARGSLVLMQRRSGAYTAPASACLAPVGPQAGVDGSRRAHPRLDLAGERAMPARRLSRMAPKRVGKGGGEQRRLPSGQVARGL